MTIDINYIYYLKPRIIFIIIIINQRADTSKWGEEKKDKKILAKDSHINV